MVLRLLDGKNALLHAIIDNHSRKILAWTMATRLEPTATCQLLLDAGKHLVFAGRPLLYADSGIENVNGAVPATLLSACLDRVLAQVEMAFSSSTIPRCLTPPSMARPRTKMYFGTAANLPAELAAARSKARAERLAANRAMTCDRCTGQQASPPMSQIPP
jgi:hypothetical protein